MSVRAVFVAAALAGLLVAGSPARACDTNYPWLCKPVPSTDSAEAAPESKPLPITSRRAAAATRRAQARAAKAAARASRVAAKAERAAKAKSRHATGGTSARQFVLAARAKDATRQAEEEVRESRPSAPAKVAKPGKPDAARAIASATEPNVGFAVLWGERSTGTAEPVEAPVQVAIEPVMAAPAAPPPPVAVASAVNELDLGQSRSTAPSDGSWLRNLFIAFGGLLAFGSALRLFI